MLASIGSLPGPAEEAEFAYETLWNGARVLIRLPGDGTMQLVSAAGLDVTADYPDLSSLTGLLPQIQAVLDGEIITYDPAGRPSIEGLQQRMSLQHPRAVTRAAAEYPARLMVYDVLYLWQPVLHQPYTARRTLLDDLPLNGGKLLVPAAWPSMATEALHQALHEGYDGITAKRLTSPYLPGRRSRDWINIKDYPSASGKTTARSR
jgi:ATP-dependent DNA ligase